MPYVSAVLDFQMQFSGSAGAWTSLYTDVSGEVPVVIDYGIGGNSPLDRIAKTGTMTFALNNSVTNSGGKLGFYSPCSANARAGFDIGIGVRAKLVYSGSTFYKFSGWIDEIDPLPGQYGPRLTLCRATDWMGESAIYKMNGVATQTSKTADQLINTIVTSVKRQPASTCLITAQSVYPFALDGVRDEETTALQALTQVVQSDLGYLMIVGDQTAGNRLVYQDFRERLNTYVHSLTTNASLNDGMATMRTAHKRPIIFNRVKTIIHPRTVDPTNTTVLYKSASTTTIDIMSGCTIIQIGQYRGGALNAARVGGTCMIAPVATTDYTFGLTASDTTLTASLVVAASFGGNSVTLALTNNACQNGTVTLLQARGQGLYDFNPQLYSACDVTSINAYGERVIQFDLKDESSVPIASSMAAWYLNYWKNPQYVIDGVEFTANLSDANMKSALQREPGDAVTITETVTGIKNQDFYINGAKITISGHYNNKIDCEWVLTPRLDSTAYWILEVTNRGELDKNTTLGP